MESSEPKEDEKNKVDDLFSDFENEENLNLTLDEKEEGSKTNEKEDINPQIEKEFSDFLKSTTATVDNNDIFNQCSKLLENMCNPQPPTNENQQQNQQNNNGQMPDSFNFQNLFAQMMNDGTTNNQPTFDDFADKLLDQFLEKEVLYEPLQEAYTSFETLLQEKKYDLANEASYTQQFLCIKEILEILEKDPKNKSKMIELFEKMQTFGDPPQEIIKLIGPGNPINNFLSLNHNNQSQSNSDECKIF